MNKFLSFLRRKEEVGNGIEPQYKWVNASQLTVEELRKSRLPNNSLISVWSEFTSEGGKRYQAVHVRMHPKGPYILLCGLDKDSEDFGKVEKAIAEQTKGRPDGQISDRIDDICDVINLNGLPDQATIARFIEGYARLFQNVNIPATYYKDVPVSACQNSGLKPEKLTFSSLE